MPPTLLPLLAHISKLVHTDEYLLLLRLCVLQFYLLPRHQTNNTIKRKVQPEIFKSSKADSSQDVLAQSHVCGGSLHYNNYSSTPVKTQPYKDQHRTRHSPPRTRTACIHYTYTAATRASNARPWDCPDFFFTEILPTICRPKQGAHTISLEYLYVLF